ncbi:hypothetical protein L6164_035939 [Bauhinia variegata]|uniref:Uncharacterized protein n=1 Tax=Bauhinia variegata TaxID=167791 RepID=A0ACB9KFM0_BAUVA|nr:hypothetical protein L6164_035939 [Bauhinia variegata]
MKSYWLILLSLFSPFPPMFAQTSSSDEPALVNTSRFNSMEMQVHVTSLQTPHSAKLSDLGYHKGQILTRHHQRHLQNMHGILILIGWGTLLPIGVIIARYCRKFPLMWNEWLSCHVVCQTLGYILGTVGWCIGMWLGSSSKQYVSNTQRILSIIAFTFINVQMLSIFLRPNQLEVYCKCWHICHHVLGYTIIAIVIANIIEGINNQSQAEKWKWAYVGIIAALALVAAALEIFRYIKTKIMHQSMQL